MRSASRATATSRPSCGTPRASCQMNGVGASDSIAAPAAELPVNRWIIGEVVETLAKLDRAFDELRYDEMADAIYHFVWGTFCDWYVELIKGAFDEETKARRRLGVRPDPGHAPPAHAVHHRGTVERERAALRADRREMAGAGGAGRSARPRRELDWLIAAGQRSAFSARPSSSAAGAKLRRCIVRGRVRTKLRAAASTAMRAAASKRLGSAGVDPAARTDSPEPARPQVVVDEATFVLAARRRDRHRRRAGAPRKAAEAAEKERDSLAAAPRQPELHRARQARSGREGARRPRCQGGRGRAVAGGAGAAGVDEPVMLNLVQDPFWRPQAGDRMA